jgi:hypothetical protein
MYYLHELLFQRVTYIDHCFIDVAMVPPREPLLLGGGGGNVIRDHK